MRRAGKIGSRFMLGAALEELTELGELRRCGSVFKLDVEIDAVALQDVAEQDFGT